MIGLLIVVIILLVCSCNNEMLPVQDEVPVAFSAKDNGTTTRATITTDLRKIGVFGYSHTGNFNDELALRFPDFFLNQPVADLQDNDIWTYSGVRKYWPQDGRYLSFFAYAPYIDVEDIFTLYPASVVNAGTPTIDYTVPSGIIDQIDLVYGNRMNMTYADSDDGEVELTLDHALTRVDFVVKLDEKEMVRPFKVEFNELTVRNVVGNGTLNIGKAMDDPNLWTTMRPNDVTGWVSYTMTPGGHGGLANLVFDTRLTEPDVKAGEIDAWNWNRLFIPGQYLMLIPQDLEGKVDGLTPAEVQLKYTVTNIFTGEVSEREEIIPLWLASLPKWKPGMGVTYQITISILEGIEIEFEIEAYIDLTPWVDKNSNDPVYGTVG